MVVQRSGRAALGHCAKLQLESRTVQEEAAPQALAWVSASDERPSWMGRPYEAVYPELLVWPGPAWAWVLVAIDYLLLLQSEHEPCDSYRHHPGEQFRL